MQRVTSYRFSSTCKATAFVTKYPDSTAIIINISFFFLPLGSIVTSKVFLAAISRTTFFGYIAQIWTLSFR
jgi:hypothetical protein